MGLFINYATQKRVYGHGHCKVVFYVIVSTFCLLPQTLQVICKNIATLAPSPTKTHFV